MYQELLVLDSILCQKILYCYPWSQKMTIGK